MLRLRFAVLVALGSSLVACPLTACGGSDVVDDDGSSSGGGSATTGSQVTGVTGATTGPGATTNGSTDSTTVGPGSGGASGTSTSTGTDTGTGAGTGTGTGTGGGPPDEPVTCEQAVAAKTNLGCDFWPTVTSNLVWDIFDYAVVVTNSGIDAADVTVERNGNAIDEATVAPGDSHTFFLPWVDALKGPDVDCNGSVVATPSSARANGGAYHVTSTAPIAVYQLSPIEYSPDAGGPSGKDWSDCPGLACGTACFSYTNDASLVLPSTSLGTEYRVVAYPSWTAANLGSFLSIAATEDDTTVDVDLSALAAVTAGNGIAAVSANGTATYSLDRGDVVQLLASVPGDFSGTLVTSNHPIQVMTGIGCTYVPEGASACDHLEETIFPVSSLGAHYVVARPTGASGTPNPHVVRIVGQVNGTTLTYSGSVPAGAPTTINAGQLVDLGEVSGDFEIVGSNTVAVATFLLGASATSTPEIGDPSQSIVIPVENFRRRYELVTPLGWVQQYLDVIAPTDANVTVDGAPIAGTRTPLSADYAIIRTAVTSGADGGHVVESDQPVSVQVIGYGEYSSYQFPAGVSLQ